MKIGNLQTKGSGPYDVVDTRTGETVATLSRHGSSTWGASLVGSPIGTDAVRARGMKPTLQALERQLSRQR